MKKFDLISLMLIFVLFTSPFVTSFGDVIALDQKQTITKPTLDQKPTAVTLSKDYNLLIQENTIRFTEQQVTVSVIKSPTINQIKRIQITEGMTMTNQDGNNDAINIVKVNRHQAILEHIFNQRKSKFDNVVGIPLFYDSPVQSITDTIDQLSYDTGEQLDNGRSVLISDQQHDSLLYIDNNVISDTQFFIDSVYVEFTKQTSLIAKQIDQQSTSIVAVFAISAFYIIIRSENPKLQIHNYKRLLAFAFIVLILSSSVTIPASISDSYYAHAEEYSNSTEPIGPPSTSFGPQEQPNVPALDIIDISEPVLPVAPTQTIPATNSTQTIPATNSTQTIPATNSTQTIPATNSTQTIPATNSTQTIPATNSTQTIPATNSTQTIPATNSTQTIPATNSTQTIPATNSTQTIPATNSTQTIPATNSTQTIPATNSTQTIPATNSTQTIPATNSTQTIPATNSTQTIPATNSTQTIVPIPTWSLDQSLNGTQIVGDALVNQTGIVLDGGFVKSNSTKTNSTALTITAWVKPDYASGSSVFTIMSKEAQFKLVLNNVLDPKHIPIFSIFDGIRWHSVSGNDKIGGGWSHIGASFNGSDVSIYTNGTLSKTSKIKALDTTSGLVEQTSVQIQDSDSDVIVGALVDPQSVDTAQATFAGNLDELQIYDEYLNDEQIYKIYNQTLAAKTTRPIINATIPIIDLEPISLLNNTSFNGTLNVNGTLNANSTQIIIGPQVNVTSQITIAAWIIPDYLTASDEMTIVSKEKSFTLSINNILDPIHVAKFSVFDGLRWDSITGLDKIESQSHIAAVINGTDISLYVNGTLQNSKTLKDVFVVSEHGLSTTAGGVVDSDASVIIGAYQSTLRSEPKLENKFAGTIDGAIVYPRALDANEIRSLYSSKFAQAHGIDLLESLQMQDNVVSYNFTGLQIIPIIDTNQTNITIEADPTLTQTKPSYLINEEVEFQLEYYDESEILLMQIADLENKLAELIMQSEQDKAQTENNTDVTTGNNSTDIVGLDNSTSILPTNDNSTVSVDPIGYLIAAFLPFAGAQETTDDSVLEQISQTKLKLKQLREKLTKVQQDNTIKAITPEITDQIKEITDDLSIINQNVTDTTLLAETEDLEDIGTYLNNTSTQSTTETQYEIWQENNNTITTEIYSPQGQLIQTLTKYEKLREGKFNIKLTPEQAITPGIYKITTIIQVGDSQYTLQDEFAWGLVSLNTKKSIYKPGETADLEIVVLDNAGHPVCNSAVSMTIIDSLLQNTTLSTGNGITQNADCGIYDAQYLTGPEGIYQVQVSATTPTGTTSFETDFTVQSYYDYDIIRTAQSKIDPTINPNSFEVKINVTSFVGGQEITIREFVPQQLEIVTDGLVQNINGTKSITWVRTLQENKTEVSYTYSIPMVFPRLYALGKAEITQVNSTFTEARNWYVAADPAFISEEGGILFYRGVDTTEAGGAFDKPKFRIFDRTFGGGAGGFDEQHELPSAGSPINHTKVVYSNTGRILAVVQSFDGTLDSYHCDYNCTDTNNWTQISDIADVSSVSNQAESTRRKFDVAFEQKSGRALLVFDRNDTASKGLAFRVLDNSSDPSWNATTDINDATTQSGSGDQFYTWIKMDPNPLSSNNAILVGAINERSRDTLVLMWNGLRFGSMTGGASAGGNAVDIVQDFNGGHLYPAYDLKWTQNGTNAIFMTASNTATSTGGDLKWSTLSGNAWSTATSLDTNNAANIPRYVDLYRESITGRMMLAVTDSGQDLEMFHYDMPTVAADPNTWRGRAADRDASLDGTNLTRSASFAWNATNLVLGNKQSTPGSNGLAVWDTDGATAGFHRIACKANCTGTASSSTTNLSGTGAWNYLVANPQGSSSTDMIGFRSTTTDVLAAYRVSGSTYTVYDSSISSDTAQNRAEPFSFAFRPIVLGNHTVNIIESLGITDAVTATKSVTVSLSEKLGLVDNIQTTKSKTQTITESLGMTDNLGRTFSATLSEKLGIVDTITTAKRITLTENLGLRDRAVDIVPAIGLIENLGIRDNITITLSRIISLNEKLGITDTAATTSAFTVSLTERLGLTDTTTTTLTRLLSLTERLGLTDQTTTTLTRSLSLTESLGITDQTTRSTSITLTENLGITDTTTKTPTVTLTESLGLTDTVTKTPSITLTENLGLTDTVTKTPSITLTENLGITDTTTKTPTVTLTESLGLTDTVTKTPSITLTESLGITDQTTRSTSITLTENLGITDTTTKTPTVTLTESLGLTDTVTKTPSITLTENLGLTDTVTKTPSITLTENLGITDTTTKTPTVTLTESLGLTDTVTKTPSITLTESLGITDQTTRSTSITLTENLGITDTTTKTPTVTLTESLGLTDTVTKTPSITLTENLGLTDTVTKTPSITLTENLGITDTTTKTPTVTLTESLGLTDTVTKTPSITLTESLGITDQTTRSTSITLTENLGITDTTTKTPTVTLTESLGLTDTVTKTPSITLTESLGITDQTTRSTSITLTENLGITDTTTKTPTVTLTESLGLTDTVTKTPSITLTENLGLTDTVTKTPSITLTENLGITDTTTKTPTVTLTESLGLTDTVTKTPSITLTESLGITDQTTRSTSITLTENLGITDTTTKTPTVTLTESLGLTDTVTKTPSITLTESLGITDQTTRSTSITLTENLGITDTTTKTPTVTLTESLGLTDTVTKTPSITLTENLGLTDTVTKTPSITLTENLGITDTTTKTPTVTLTESLGLTDTVTKTPSITLTESLGITDQTTRSTSITLTENLGITDTTTKTPTVTLTESLGLTDTVTKTPSITLTENLGLTDTVTKTPSITLTENLGITDTTTKTPTVTLTESLGLTDTVTKTPSITLTESLGITDQTTRSTSITLTENLGITDTTTKTPTVTLTESLGLTDTVTKTPSITLTESLGITDQTTRSTSITLTENLGITDTTTKTPTVTLTESLGLTDTVTKTPSITLTENLGLTDTVTKTPSITLTENLGITDTTTKTPTVTLTESLGLTDTVTKTPSITLTENLGLTDTVTKTPSITLTENLGITDTTTKTPTVTLTESLGLTDTVTKTPSITLTENLGLTDTVTKTPSITLTENLGITDTTTKTPTVTLTESLGLTDTVTKTPSITLTENLGLTDTVTKTPSITLTENLGITDTTTKTPTVTLTESLGLTDTVTKTPSITLTESLGITDQTTRSTSITLTENLGITDTTTKTPTVTLTESLGLTDTVTKTPSITLTENLGLTATTLKTPSVTLTESLGITDQTTRTATVTLTERLGLTDTVTKTPSITLTENLGLTDTVTKTPSITLTESLGMADTQKSTFQKTLTEKLGFTDTIRFKGGWIIEARNPAETLIGGATYTIYPNPNGGSSFTVTDNDSNDLDPTVGRVGFSEAPYGTYNVTMVTVPSGYNVLGNSTLHEVHATNNKGISLFRVNLQSSSLAMLAPVVITTAPDLNATTYTTWTDTFSASIINGSSTTTFSTVSRLPGIVSVGNGTSQLEDAITKQASVKLSTSFTSQTSGLAVINSLGIGNYSMSNSPFTTAIIPSMVTAASGTSSQFVATPPLTKIVPGQAIVVPVETSLLPSYGGLVRLSVDPMDGKSSVSGAKNDWFVVESASTIPSALGTSGITNDHINLFVDVSYQYEATSKGFDWSKESNFASKPTLAVRVAKSTAVESDSNGCPIMTAYTLNRSTNTWVQTGITITTPSSVNANSCDVTLSTPHFSEFALTSKAKASASSSSSSASGGAGGDGGGRGASGASIGTVGAPGTVANPIILYQAQYDTCDKNMVRIIAGVYGSEAPPPHVKIRTPDREVYSATLAKDQPYLEHNKILQVSRYVYEAPISKDLKYFVITAEQVNGRIATSASYLVNVYGCSDTIIINPMTDLDKIRVDTVIEEGRPNIFDVKFQIGSGKPVSSTAVNQFIQGNEKVTVSGIIDSQTELRRAELRVVTGGNNYTDYAAVKMDVAPLAGVPNTYFVSAQLPESFIQTPAIIYWIHVVNQEEKIQASEKYYLGVKPTYPLDARLELDTPIAKSQGSTLRPSAYVYNEGKPLFGSVSLLVNGKIVHTSTEYVFKDITAIDLAWEVPELDSQTSYDIKARLNLYDKAIDTASTTVNTFKSTKSYSISDVINVQSIVDEQQKLVARAGLLYSSDSNPNLHYRVVSPDGKCVVGGSDSCMVKHSTLGKRGNAESIEINGQIFRVRYSGQDSPLERFSITSVDPIEGVWTVSLESDGIIPEAHASEDTLIKIKYRTMFAKPITLTSDLDS